MPRMVATAIGQIDPALEDASRICGAGWTATMRRVMVPLVAPAVLSGAILVTLLLVLAASRLAGKNMADLFR